MSTSRDLNRLMEAFMEDGPAVLTDRVAEAIRDDVERTEQRVVFGPWRTPLMSRFAIAAAIVTIALLGGVAVYSALIQPPNVGPPVVSPAPEIVQSARAAGLRYVNDGEPGIMRTRAGKGFSQPARAASVRCGWHEPPRRC